MSSSSAIQLKYFVIVGLAVSGAASFVNTYNSLSGINSIDNCTQTAQYKNALQTKFLVTLILSILAIVIGIILMFIFKRTGNPHNIITMGIILAGVIGFIYSFFVKYKNFGNGTLTVISWGTFIAFIILGILSDQLNISSVLIGPFSKSTQLQNINK